MIRIRKPNASDAAAMGNIYCKSWQAGYKGIVPQDFLDSLTPENSAPHGIDPGSAFVAELDGEVVGLITFHPAREADMPDSWEIRSFYVLPQHWRSGVGSALFAAVRDEFRRRGAQQFCLRTLRENRRARAFYEKMGMHLAEGEHFFEVAGSRLPEVRYEAEV